MAMTAPQPKTFAPSREDVLTTLSYFFGSPVSPEKLKDYSEHHAQTYHFPDAYVGLNTKLRDTMNNLVLKGPQNWQTSVCLPFVQITGTVVEWDEIHFDVRLLQRVPYEGVSRMQTSLRRRHRDRVVRRGLGMMIESDFYATDAGRKHFADQLTSIRYCVQETCNFDVLFSLLICGNYDFRYDMAKGLRPRRAIKTAMQHELMMFAISQKDGLGMDRAVEEVKYRMSRYGVTPNMLIIPPQLSLYLAMAPNEKTLFVDGGAKAVSEFDSGRTGFETRAFRGLGVVTSEPFEVADDQDSVQMLSRSTQVGEFYVMRPPPFPPKAGVTGFMDIFLYDEEGDRHVRISWADALKATGAKYLVDPGGGGKKAIKMPDVPAFTKGADLTAGETNNAESNTADEFGAWYGHAEWLAEINEKGMLDAYKDAYNKRKGIYIVIAKPFIEHLMHSAIAMVSGRDTGATLFGPADMQISANTQVKTIEGHYTGHFKSVVTKPQNVFVMRDIACGGYVAGGNCDFFANIKTATATQMLSSAAKNMQDRLNFASDPDRKYGSMLAFPLLPSQWNEGKIDNTLSITSRLLPWDTNNDKPRDTSFPGGQAFYDIYNAELGLDTVHYGEDVRASENMEYVSQGSVNNSLCFLGPHRVFAPLSLGDKHELIPGQGHFGPDAVPGDARWRRGEVVSLKAARDAISSTSEYKFGFA